MIDPVLRLMIEVVHRYSGYVAQSTGDGIFAMFGAPVAHEAGQKTPFSTQPGPVEYTRSAALLYTCLNLDQSLTFWSARSTRAVWPIFSCASWIHVVLRKAMSSAVT
jgi:class 3 adenylate cyclase